MKGKVYFIGAGPGNEDLITLKGQRILCQADVVIYDFLVDSRMVEQLKQDTILISCKKLYPPSQRNNRLPRPEKINQRMVKYAREGKVIARLKIGDPFIFGRTAQEMEALIENDIEFEVVPGVSAAQAGAAYSGIPLTERSTSSSCVFVTGKENPNKLISSINWASIARQGTIVVFMTVSNLYTVTQKLILGGKSKETPVALIQNASLPTQKTLFSTLENISLEKKKQNISSPAVLLVGKEVSAGHKYNWLRKNKKILYTGISEPRYNLPGTYFHLPLISIHPLKDYSHFDRQLKVLHQFEWLIFTSRYGVKYFFERLYSLNKDTRSLARQKIAAIGTSTSRALKKWGVVADLVPAIESSHGLVQEFREISLDKKGIFMPRSNLSDKGLTNKLTKMGAEVTAEIAYRNLMPRSLPDLDLNFFDEIMFTSPSGVRNFVRKYRKVPQGVKINYIGHVTEKELIKKGMI